MTDRILQILKEIRPESDFAGSADFLADGLLDSFDMVTLVATLDKAFSISIEGTEIIPENFSSADTIRRLLLKYGVNP
jgi:acyl carrier protein